jgi:hypothetical protein
MLKIRSHAVFQTRYSSIQNFLTSDLVLIYYLVQNVTLIFCFKIFIFIHQIEANFTAVLYCITQFVSTSAFPYPHKFHALLGSPNADSADGTLSRDVSPDLDEDLLFYNKAQRE